MVIAKVHSPQIALLTMPPDPKEGQPDHHHPGPTGPALGGMPDPAEHVMDRLDRTADASSSDSLDMLQEEEQMVNQLQRHFQHSVR